jgi:hypothetical protein
MRGYFHADVSLFCLMMFGIYFKFANMSASAWLARHRSFLNVWISSTKYTGRSYVRFGRHWPHARGTGTCTVL